MTRARRRRRSWAWPGLILAVLLAGGFYFFNAYFQRIGKAYPRNAFYEVKRADLLISVVEEGALRALNETVVRSSLEGYNRIIHLVPEGSYVRKGELLVELDSSGLRDRLNEQELGRQERLFMMEQAKGNLSIQRSLTESQIKDAELKVENAQADFEKYRDADAPFLIRTVEARSEVLAEQVRIARERSVRTEELLKGGNATKSELEADALSLKREQLALSQYQEDLRLIKKYDQPQQLRLLQSKMEQAKAELERLKHRTSNEIAQAEADLKTSQSALEFLDENLDTLRHRLASTKILAPQNGLVVYAQVSPFQFGGGEERRQEGRFRMGRGGEGGGGEFRGGGGRRGGGRNNSDGGSRGGASSSSAAETVSSGFQRIASAVSGSSVTGSGGSGGGAGNNAGAASSGGSGGSGGSGSGGSGQTVSSAGAGFASYSSMRPSSAFGASSTSNSAANGAAGAGAISLSSTGGQNSSFNIGGQQQTFRQNRDFGGFDFFGTPGVLEAGIMVRQRQELVRLPDISKMLAEIKIGEARVAQVRAGMPAYIKVSNIPHRQFKGTVRRVALLPDAQSSWMNPDAKLFPADILVEEELPILKPGVSATAEIIITNLTKVLSVPIQTVTRLLGENVCYLKKGSRVVPVPVTTGWYSEAFVEIKSGLNEGDLVLLAPASDEESDEEETSETNAVESSTSPPPRPPSPERPPVDERMLDNRQAPPADGDAPSERPRGRRGPGSRSRNSANGPE